MIRKTGDKGEVELDSGVKVTTDVDGFSVGRALPRGRAARRSSRSAPVDAGDPSVEGLVESSLYLGTSTQLIVKLAEDVRMTVLVPNTDEAERQRLPGGGANVKLSWAPDHMHVVKESATNGAVPPEDGGNGLNKPDRREQVTSKRRFRALIAAGGALAAAIALAACGGGGVEGGGGHAGRDGR